MPLRNSPSRDPNRAAPSAEGLRLTQADSLLAVSLLVNAKLALPWAEGPKRRTGYRQAGRRA